MNIFGQLIFKLISVSFITGIIVTLIIIAVVYLIKVAMEGEDGKH